MHRKLPLLLLLLLLCAAPGGAHAGDKEEGGDFGSIALWDASGITGDSESYANTLAIVLSPSLRLGRLLEAPKLLQPLRLSVELSVQFELSGNDASFRGPNFTSPAQQPGGAEAIAVNEVGSVVGAPAGQVQGTGRSARLSDLWLGLSHASLYNIPLVGVDLGAHLSLLLPTSTLSQNSGFMASINGGISLSRTLWRRLDLGYSFTYNQYFYRYTTNDVRTLPQEVEINGRLEPLYQPNHGTVLNPFYGFINEFSASVRIIQGLSLAVAYSLTNTFTHEMPEAQAGGHPLADPCGDGQAVAADGGGAVVPCGERAQRDTHWFQVRLSYRVLPLLSITAGLNTVQPVRHEGGGISNPFLQTVPTANYTTVELGLSTDLEHTVSAITGLFSGRE